MLRKKLILLAGTALSLGFAMEANAAPPVPNTWTGVYLGGNIGYSFGSVDTTVSVAPFFYNPFSYPFPGASNSLPLRPNGVIGGFQAGYNWDFASRWLVGIEADWQWSGQRDSATRSIVGVDTTCTFSPCNFLNTTDITAKLSWFSTVRGRVGVFAAPNILFYGTAGVAIGEISVSGTNRLTLHETSGGGSVTFLTPFSYSGTRVGYAVGAGVEGRVGTSGWTWKVEYLHLDFGSIGTAVFGTVPAVTVTSGRFTDEIVRVGFNYQITGRP